MLPPYLFNVSNRNGAVSFIWPGLYTLLYVRTSLPSHSKVRNETRLTGCAITNMNGFTGSKSLKRSHTKHGRKYLPALLLSI